MRFYIKQKVFSFKDQFKVKDEQERDAYYVEGKTFSLGNKLHIYNMQNEEILYIEQKLFSLKPAFELYKNSEHVATVKKSFNLFKNNYTIEGTNWTIEGSILEHNYVINNDSGRTIAEVNRKLISWGDAYSIDIYDEKHVETLLGVVIVIDTVSTGQN